MPSSFLGYFFIIATIVLTVYGQIVTKWQVRMMGAMPTDMNERMMYFLRLLINPWVISSLVAAFLAFLSWVGAMSKFDLSYAYPFTSASFMLVLLFSVIVFHEPITMPKIGGLILIMAGIIVASRG